MPVHEVKAESLAGQNGQSGQADVDERSDLWEGDSGDSTDRKGEDGEMEADDNDGDLDALAEDEDQWQEIVADPLQVRFTQEKIHPFFYRRGPIVNVLPKIRAVESAEGDGTLDLMHPFTMIHCLQKGEELWSLDNRRLYALQLAAMELWPQRCRIRVLVRDRLPRHKFKTHYRKFNTTSEGRTIDVCTRFQTFDTWSWFQRAVELEWYQLSRRLGVILSVFEAAPMVGALLFRSGLTGYSSRWPFIVAFLLAFTVDLVRQKVPVLEQKLAAVQVRAVVDGDIVRLGTAARLLRLGGNVDGDGPEASLASTGQMAATMAIMLVLSLPYILGITRDKLRSSLFSCWLGIACVLALQLAGVLQGALARRRAAAVSPKLTPKHR